MVSREGGEREQGQKLILEVQRLGLLRCTMRGGELLRCKEVQEGEGGGFRGGWAKILSCRLSRSRGEEGGWGGGLV